jgi:hypothetical protein
LFHLPPTELAPTCVRGVVSGAVGDGPLNPVQADVVTAMSNLFGVPVDPAAVERIDPADLAAAVADPAFRHQLVVAMIGLSLMVHPADPGGPARIAAYAKALDVDEPMLAATRRYVEGNRAWMMFDFARHSAFRPLLKQQVDDRGLLPLLRQVGALKGMSKDRPLANKFRGLELYPAGSWGRALWDFYKLQGWRLPGEKGAVPQATSEHDWVHVLSGYPTTPLGEIQVTAFMAANAPDDVAFSLLFLSLGVYETGAIRIPLGPSHVGTLADAPDGGAQLADAIRRGAACTVDSLFMDHWAHAERPLAEVRKEFGIGPKHLPGPDPVPSLPTKVIAATST